MLWERESMLHLVLVISGLEKKELEHPRRLRLLLFVEDRHALLVC